MSTAATQTKPKRIQRKRTKNWRKPEGTIYVGRPSRWGNPYGKDSASLERYEEDVREALVIFPKMLDPLRDHDLMCWCSPQSKCHADILLRLANQ